MDYHLLKPKWDSFRLEIPTSKATSVGRIKIPYRKVGMFEYDGLILDGTEEKPLVDLNQVHREKGITFRTEIHRRTIGNQQFEERYVLQISSKMLKERYFEGIDISNIHLLYQYIIDLKIIDFSYEVFLQANVYDMDMCMDVECSADGWLKLCRKVNAHINPSKFKYANLFGSGTNIGLELNKRDKATNTNPFVKLYHKGTEMVNKKDGIGDQKGVFNGEYCGGGFHNIGRLEFSVKNREHVKYLGLQMRTLTEMLSCNPKDLVRILKTEPKKNYMEKRIINRLGDDRLPIKDDMLYNLVRYCIELGEEEDFFTQFAERYNGDYTEKARYRKLIQKWIKLEEFQKGMETNLEINKEGNLAGKKLGLFS
jgi:hypothetical protein